MVKNIVVARATESDNTKSDHAIDRAADEPKRTPNYLGMRGNSYFHWGRFKPSIEIPFRSWTSAESLVKAQKLCTSIACILDNRTQVPRDIVADLASIIHKLKISRTNISAVSYPHRFVGNNPLIASVPGSSTCAEGSDYDKNKNTIFEPVFGFGLSAILIVWGAWRCFFTTRRRAHSILSLGAT